MIDFEKLREIFENGFSLKTKKGDIKRKDLAYIPKKDNKKTREALAEVERNHNHSWYDELYQRSKNRLYSPALLYRGDEISYKRMMDKMMDLAKALKAYGVKKGDEIPICLGNTPELIYLMGAASIIGAKINVFGPKFDKEYVTKILNKSNSSLMFIEDNHYERLKDCIANSNIKDIVMISLSDSLVGGLHPDDRKDNAEKFTSKVELYKSNNPSVMSFKEFEKLGKSINEKIESNCTLDDEFSITYTSGSTNAKHPKQIVHNNRSYILMARHHDKDMSGGIDMSKFTFLAHLPSYSNTDLISCISDSLMQGSRVALEPISDRDFFVKSLMINKPHCVIGTTSYWIKAMKELLYNPEYEDITLPNLLLAFGAGEPMCVNEELFLNKGLRKVEAGSNIIPPMIKSTVMSAGGGDCEHGSIFYGILRRLYERKDSHNYIEEAGNKLSDFAELAVLDKNGSYCSKGEIGRIVANSGCTMEYYKDDPEATDKFFIKDAYGKVWGDCSVYGYVDKKNRVHVKGRIIEEDEKIPTFLINDEVLKDQVNILSATTVHIVENGTDYYIVHFEKMPETIVDSNTLVKEAMIRIKNKFGNEVASHTLFREHSFEESFALTGSGKRDYKACQNEGISDKTIKIEMEKTLQKKLKK